MAGTEPKSLARLAAALPELWSPRVVARIDNVLLKVARVEGEFPWHTHDAEDELFLVLRGELTIGRSDADGGPILLREGEFYLVERGQRHSTSAATETWIALLEPASTLHTGSTVSHLTRSLDEQLRPLSEE